MGSHETAAIHSSDIVLTSFSLANRITDKNIILDFGGLIDWMMIEACLSIQTQISTADNFLPKHNLCKLSGLHFSQPYHYVGVKDFLLQKIKF